MARATRKLTYADYETIPDDGHRHEIIEGEEFMTPAPEVPHQRVSRKIVLLLGAFVARNALGEVFHAPIDVVLSDEDVVQPDIVFVSTARSNLITRKNIRGGPDLVVEILSRSTASVDRGAKLALYQRSGVTEYWLVEPEARTVEVRELGSPRRVRIYKEEQSFESTVLRGLTVRLAEIF